MKYSYIARFKKSINKLKKPPYTCIKSHIFEEFINLTDQEIYELGYSLSKANGVVSFSKVRIASCGDNGKSAGFRVIILVNLKTKETCFLEVYPKTGPFAISNIKTAERKQILNEYNSERDIGQLNRLRFDKKRRRLSYK